jgi:hypothetical protein
MNLWGSYCTSQMMQGPGRSSWERFCQTNNTTASDDIFSNLPHNAVEDVGSLVISEYRSEIFAKLLLVLLNGKNRMNSEQFKELMLGTSQNDYE